MAPSFLPLRRSCNAQPHRPPTTFTFTTDTLLVTFHVLLTSAAPKHAMSMHGTSEGVDQEGWYEEGRKEEGRDEEGSEEEQGGGSK